MREVAEVIDRTHPAVLAIQRKALRKMEDA